MGILSKIFGDEQARFLKKTRFLAEKVNKLENQFEKLQDCELKNQTSGLKERLGKGETLDDILSEAFALVRESSKRTLKQRQFDVQLIGGIVLHQGKIAEMKTGEGKTLTATLAVYLNALEGKGVHVVTVNDYLAKRDTVWMGQIYNMLGMSVGCIVNGESFLHEESYNAEIQNSTPKESFVITQDPTGQELKINDVDLEDKERDIAGGFRVEESFLKPCERREAYGADITYGTNNEFGFDYLRDNLVFELKEKVQRGFNFAIVDEIDSILIDEARTPLIISQPDLESSEMYRDFAKIMPFLKENTDYNIDEKLKAATLTEQGIENLERILGVSDIYTEKGIKYLHHLEQALRAKVFFQKDRDYIIKDGQVIIIDEFTGRILPGRRYSGGLHQAIEAKEKVKVQAESKTLATITFQNYFRFYKKLAGMTGTALTSAEEFDKVYKLEVVSVPSNKLLIRKDLTDQVYKTEGGKLKAVAMEIKKRHEQGQPVLVGTRSVEKNEYLSKLLNREGIQHEILNAKNHSREGEIIAQAGKWGAVTVATNMAGRGVDIMLGGTPPSKFKIEEGDCINPEYLQWEKGHDKIVSLGGLCVIGTERHEARRIDDQLRGRCGRQGDPGTTIFFLSLGDELLRIFGGDRIMSLMNMLKIEEDQPISTKMLSGVIEKAQTKIEGMNFDLRKHILEYDDVVSKHRNKIYFQRMQVLEKNYQEIKEMVLEKIKQEIASIVHFHQTERGFDHEEIYETLKTILSVSDEIHFQLQKFDSLNEIIDYLEPAVEAAFQNKENAEGAENMERILRFVCLRTMDFFWSEHLDTLEHLKDSVRLRAYGGRDPLVEYKTESHKLFQNLESAMDAQIARTVFKVSLSAR